MSAKKIDQTLSLFPQDNPKPIERKGQIHIGTSGYTFQDWKENFYPKGLSQKKWLQYYSQFFTVIEINATYYRMLPYSSFERMVNTTPPDFGFWIKLPSEVTHSKIDLKRILPIFLDSIAPVFESGKLCGVLAQFPFSFKNNSENRSRIREIGDLTGEINLAIEFRSEDWFRDEIFSFLLDLDSILVAIDLPDLKGLPQNGVRNINKMGYARLHGRNSRTWYNNEIGDRYDYNYSIEELRYWVGELQKMDENAPLTYLFFNNCHAGQAVKNARMMKKILELEFK